MRYKWSDRFEGNFNDRRVPLGFRRHLGDPKPNDAGLWPQPKAGFGLITNKHFCLRRLVSLKRFIELRDALSQSFFVAGPSCNRDPDDRKQNNDQIQIMPFVHCQLVNLILGIWLPADERACNEGPPLGATVLRSPEEQCSRPKLYITPQICLLRITE